MLNVFWNPVQKSLQDVYRRDDLIDFFCGARLQKLCYP